MTAVSTLLAPLNDFGRACGTPSMESADYVPVPRLLRARELIPRYNKAMKAPTKEQALKSTWLFSECSAKELRSIAGIADEVTVPEGKVLVEQGAIGREFYLITSGSASVKRNGRHVATLKKGQHFGELALLDRRPRNATVISATEMTVMVLGQREFNGLIETVPSLARKLLAAMAGRVRDQDRKAVQ